MAHPAVVEAVRQLDEVVLDQLLDNWLRRFTAVPDRALRRTVLREYMMELDDASLIGVFHRMETRARDGAADCRWLSAELALTPSVVHELPYERVSELYTAAAAVPLPRVAARFLSGRAVGDDRQDNPHLDLSAGERTAAARRQDRMVLDRLLHDRDPRVIGALLDNPRITEADVVRIAAMRPTNPAVLERIANHSRWAHRHRIRKALAFNPCTPAPLARQILPVLLVQDLRDLAAQLPLAPELRALVQELLTRSVPGSAH